MVDAALISTVYEAYKEPMASCATILKEKDVEAAKEALKKFWAERKEEVAAHYKEVPEGDREEVLETVFKQAGKYLLEQGVPEDTVKTFMASVKEMGEAAFAKL